MEGRRRGRRRSRRERSSGESFSRIRIGFEPLLLLLLLLLPPCQCYRPAAPFSVRRRVVGGGDREELPLVFGVASQADWEEVAALRSSVFNQSTHPRLRHRLVGKALHTISSRAKEKGAVLMACREERGGRLVGTLEFSRHEFEGTPLAAKDFSNVYVTEVAVEETVRQMGVGKELMMAGMCLAYQGLGSRAAYLHVSETNIAAVRLYESLDFLEVKHSPPTYAFTSSLGLADSFFGARHLLMKKELGAVEAKSVATIPPSAP